MTDEQRERRLTYRRKYDEERRNWLDEHGMCHKCGKRKVLEGRKFCPVCIEKNVINCMKKYQKKPESEMIYDGKPYSERRKELYRQKRENGICVKCTNKATHGRLCWECFRKCKKINDRRLQRQKDQRWDRGLIPEYRKENGLCCFCGNPVENPENHGRACNACAVKMSLYSMRGDKTYWRALNRAAFAKKEVQNNAVGEN